MQNLLLRLKPRLSENEYCALKKATREISDAHTKTEYDVFLAVRHDISYAYTLADELRNNIRDALSVCRYVSAVKTLYLADRNNRQTTECSYEVEGDISLVKKALITATANAHLLVNLTKTKDAFTLLKGIKLFNDLKFLAGEVKADKSVYTDFGRLLEKRAQSLDLPFSKKLVPLYLSLVSLEDARAIVDGFQSVFSAIKRTSDNTEEILFWSEKGLNVYGYDEQCETLRAYAIEKFLQNDTRFSPALISEIIINN